MISQLLHDLERLAGNIKKNKAVNVNSQKTKQEAIDLGSAYFRDFRGHVVGVLRDSANLESYDEDWQQLIRLAHGNNPKTTYDKLIRQNDQRNQRHQPLGGCDRSSDRFICSNVFAGRRNSSRNVGQPTTVSCRLVSARSGGLSKSYITPFLPGYSH